MTTALVWVPITDPRLDLRGAAWSEPVDGGLRPHRLPAWCRDRMPDGFARLCDEQAAGVRVRLRTAARQVVLRASTTQQVVEGSERPAAGVWDLVVDGVPAGSVAVVTTGTDLLEPASGAVVRAPGDPVEVRFVVPGPPAERDLEIWLPYGEQVVLHELGADAPVLAATAVHLPRWVHHGSSISQGVNAASPTGTWPVVAARSAGLDLVNLGMSGNAVLDPYVARAIAQADAELVTLKVGINVVNRDCLRERTFVPALHGFLDTLRQGLPRTPVVVISPLLCPLVEATPGPTSLDPATGRFRTEADGVHRAEGQLDLRRIRDLVAGVVASRAGWDPMLHHLDGRELWGPGDEAQTPFGDAMHPDPPAHVTIGQRFAGLLDAQGWLGDPRLATTPGDTSMDTSAEILKLAGGGGARVDR